jgi:hypothetical protein
MRVAGIIEKSHTFYGIWRLISLFTRACHWTLSWARQIQFIHSHSLPSMPDSSMCCFPFKLSDQNFAFISQLSCLWSISISLDFIILGYLVKSRNYEVPLYGILPSFLLSLRHKYSLHCFLRHLQLRCFSWCERWSFTPIQNNM